LNGAAAARPSFQNCHVSPTWTECTTRTLLCDGQTAASLHAILLSNYDANLRARLVGPNVTHVSRVGEIPAGADSSRQFVLWYESEEGEQATELARHFGLWRDDIVQGSHHGVHDLIWQGTRVFLINTLKQQQSFLAFKPVHLKALKAKHAAASMHQPSSLPCAVRQCRWTMLAGDSNMRQVATALKNEQKMGRENWVRNARVQGKYLVQSARTVGQATSGSCQMVKVATSSPNDSCRSSGLSLTWPPTLMTTPIAGNSCQTRFVPMSGDQSSRT